MYSKLRTYDDLNPTISTLFYPLQKSYVNSARFKHRDTVRQAMDCMIKSRRPLKRAEVVDFVVLVGGQQFAPDVVFSEKSYSGDTEWIQVSDTVTANLAPHITHALPHINILFLSSTSAHIHSIVTMLSLNNSA